MGRKKKRIEESSSARLIPQDAPVSPMMTEGEPAGASTSTAAATSSSRKKKSIFDSLSAGCANIADTSLLKGLGRHLSAFCRLNQVPRVSGWRCAWQPAREYFYKASPALRAELGRAGFANFLPIPHMHNDRRFILAICERWFSDTNTFHFPCCELGITPLDFVMLTRIRIGGEPIPAFHAIDVEHAANLMGVALDRMIDDGAWDKKKLKISWLASSLESDGFDTVQVDSLAFDETSLLELMDPLDRISTHDWGGTIYASVLWGLRRASRGDSQSICFFYPLIELWAHEYIEPFRPMLKISADELFPRSARWGAPSDKVDAHLFQKMREELDRLTLDRVTLRPFDGLSDQVLLQCMGAEMLAALRVFFPYRGNYEYFLGDRVYHQVGDGFWIPLSILDKMTPSLTRDELLGHIQTRGISTRDLVGPPVEYAVYLAWFRKVSIGPIMPPFSVRPGATEVGGEMVEDYFQMSPLKAAFEEEINGLQFENVRLRSRLTELLPLEVVECEFPPRPTFRPPS